MTILEWIGIFVAMILGGLIGAALVLVPWYLITQKKNLFCVLGIHSRPKTVNVGASGYNYVDLCRRCGK